MARKMWIGILGFGLFLFFLIDVLFVWYGATHGLKRALGAILAFGWATWQTYRAMMIRVHSKPGGPVAEQGKN